MLQLSPGPAFPSRLGWNGYAMLLALVHATRHSWPPFSKTGVQGDRDLKSTDWPPGMPKIVGSSMLFAADVGRGIGPAVGIAQTPCMFHQSDSEPIVWLVGFLTRTQTSYFCPATGLATCGELLVLG